MIGICGLRLEELSRPVPDSGARRARTASAEALRKDLVSLVDHLTAEVDVRFCSRPDHVQVVLRYVNTAAFVLDTWTALATIRSKCCLSLHRR